jgi:hypothetical protein
MGGFLVMFNLITNFLGVGVGASTGVEDELMFRLDRSGTGLEACGCRGGALEVVGAGCEGVGGGMAGSGEG